MQEKLLFSDARITCADMSSFLILNFTFVMRHLSDEIAFDLHSISPIYVLQDICMSTLRNFFILSWSVLLTGRTYI